MKRRRDERGFITPIGLGVCIMLFFIGGLSLDLWRAFAVQRAVSAAVDGAAVAGSSGIDEEVFRDSDGSTVQLDPDRAQSLASENLGVQPNSETFVEVAIETSPESITVRAGRPVSFTLLKVLLVGEPPVIMRASATVDPRRST